jgi:hypothetical protein
MPPKKYEEHLLRGTEITANLDLGAPGASVGDVQVFEAPFFKGGAQFSFECGVCQRVRLPDLWHCVVTHRWPKGDLTVQLREDFSTPPPAGGWRFAITGGTGDYEGAHGEITYVSNTDITFRFSTQ